MKIVITIIITLLVIGIAGFFFYEEQREARYQDCMYQCETNGACLEWEQNNLDGGLRRCIKRSEPECNNICIQKYK